MVGQKVQAKIEVSDPNRIWVDNTYGVEWLQPTGGDVVRNYVTDDSEGRVVTLEETYFYSIWVTLSAINWGWGGIVEYHLERGIPL